MIDEVKVKNLMTKLDISRDEAIEIINDDKAIDSGKDLFPLTAEQEKVAKAMRKADRKPTVYKWENKRERKPNETKRAIIDDLFTFICENWPECAKNADISNIERQIDFTLNEKSYSITLIEHRKPKKE